ncbi:MAG: SRPBCC family protein [candidate division KSB1 bacterium]|nr:SRPBCC family protein [candidate division KSB1 bacterium]MDZ7305208.1 SRPBCC family protein [candidate division KSB1 bacterium]MDZ7314319.1 SRPBCC family protein [candidate division KSB1 bacterium]
MSMLKERIVIMKPVSEVWRYLDLRRWPEISSIFQRVEAQDGSMQVGSRFIVTASPGETKVQYEILTYDEDMGRLVYKRTGGSLPGKSEWCLTASTAGTKIEYTNYYQQDLNSTMLSSISRVMVRFLNDLREAIEK